MATPQRRRIPETRTTMMFFPGPASVAQRPNESASAWEYGHWRALTWGHNRIVLFCASKAFIARLRNGRSRLLANDARGQPMRPSFRGFRHTKLLDGVAAILL